MYIFNNKESQIKALVEFLDERGKSAYEFRTQNDDWGDEYLSVMIDEVNVDNVLKLNHSSNVIKPIIQAALGEGIKKEVIDQVLKDLVKAELHGVFYPDNAVGSTGPIGEVEDQVSGIDGNVNGQPVADVFEALKEGLTEEELKLAAKEMDEAYWDAKSDLIYVNADYDTWMFVICPNDLKKSLNID